MLRHDENYVLSELVADGIIDVDEMNDYRGFVRRTYNSKPNISPDEVAQIVANEIMSDWPE